MMESGGTTWFRRNEMAPCQHIILSGSLNVDLEILYRRSTNVYCFVIY
jgi:hypothetical protein